MYTKIVFALLLIMHYSLALGAIESAAMPDELHPFGKAIPHDHHSQHSHEHEHEHEHKHDHDHNHNQSNSVDQSDGVQHENAGDFHDHQHKHGINFQLNMDVPALFAFDFHTPDTHPLTPYRLAHNSPSYAPAVPPPVQL